MGIQELGAFIQIPPGALFNFRLSLNINSLLVMLKYITDLDFGFLLFKLLDIDPRRSP